jgi:hypothetical protein
MGLREIRVQTPWFHAEVYTRERTKGFNLAMNTRLQLSESYLFFYYKFEKVASRLEQTESRTAGLEGVH